MAEKFGDFVKASTKPGPACRFRICREATDIDERKALDQAMKDPGITSAAVARVLTSWGYSIRADSVTRHRRKECSCV